jgi:antitoxin component YwqK of YwqJK toxin-antitoxin module/Tfp pilus assembly protein PilF
MFKTKALLVALILCSTISRAQTTVNLINSAELLEEGVRLHQEGKYKEAIEVYNKIGPADTNYILSLYEKAYACEADSQYARGMQYCEEALAAKQDLKRLPGILNLYGMLFDDMQKYERALQLYDSTISLYPSYSFPYINKSVTLLKLKEYAKAEQLMQQAILMDPYNATFHFQLGATALSQGKVVPAFLAFSTSLFISPEGKYSGKCISYLSSISRNEDVIIEAVNKRSYYPGENFAEIEQILASKIATEKGYKVLISLDDPISRQMQVLCEKLKFDASDKDFYVQYYVPFFQKAFADGKFEPLVFQTFSGVNLPQIKSYKEKNKKQIKSIIDDAVAYLNLIRATREAEVAKRSSSENNYYFEDGNLVSHGRRNGDLSIGEWRYYFSSGNVKTVGKYNDQGKRDGTWKYYHFDGSIDAIENFKNGELEGPVEHHYDDGTVMLMGNYVNGKKEGEFLRYYNTGALNSSEQYKNGMLNGIRKVYYRSGQLNVVENYKDDVWEGEFTTYFENGKIEKTGSALNGKLTGLYRLYHDNGKLSVEGNYENGNATGVFKRYYESGTLKSTQPYLNDLSDGLFEEYHENGKLSMKYMTKKGKTVGEANYYDDDGKLFSTILFDADRIKWAKYFDKTGTQISQSEPKKGKITVDVYTADGFKNVSVPYNEKGEVDGKRTYYFKSGAIKGTDSNTAGELNGPSVDYFSNGAKRNEMTFVDGKKDGYYTSYNKHGGKKQEGWYRDDLAQGAWLAYNELGTLVTKTDYLNDEVNGCVTDYLPNGKKERVTKYSDGILTRIIQYDSLEKEVRSIDFKNGTGNLQLYGLTGKVRTEGNYLHNLMNGLWKNYFFDGTVEYERFYKNGLLDSTYHRYYFGGKPYSEGQYAAGAAYGTWKTYNEDGTLYSTAVFENDKRNGKTVYYYSSGKPEIEIDYKDDVRDGFYKRFSEDGPLVYQLRFKNGTPVGYTYPGKDGQLVAEIAIPGGNGKVETFYPNGRPSAKFAYVDGDVNGDDFLYYPDGKVWRQHHLVYGDYEGAIKNFYADGTIESEYNYIHDELNGKFARYSAEGKLLVEGSYVAGEPHGDVKYYDDNGKLKSTYKYYYGQLLGAK